MKKLLILVYSSFFNLCTTETEKMWTDFTEGFQHNSDRKPVKVANGYT